MTQTAPGHLPPPSRSPLPPPPLSPLSATVLPRSAGGPAGAPRWRVAVRRAFEGTPGRLRLLGIGAVVACLVVSLVGSAAFSTRQGALADARADAAQLKRVQEIATELVKADSLFTNGFLAYGRESTQNRAAYDTAVQAASHSIAEASGADSRDAPKLADVSTALTEYTARVAAARANNNQAYQVATGYLRQASDLLRGNADQQITGMLPTLQAVMATDARRVDDAYARSKLATWILLATALLALGGLIAVQVRLARMTRRYFNVPLVGACVAVFVVLAGGAVAMVAAQSSANRVYDGSYAQLRDIATARIQAYTAKSAESVSLVYQGNGGDATRPNKAYSDGVAEAAARLAHVGGTAELRAWTAAHDAVFAQAAGDATNAWQAAAENAIAAGTKGKPTINSTFAAFDQASSQALEQRYDQVENGLGRGRLVLRLLTWIAVVVGVLAAVAAWTGLAQRLEEYR